MEKVSIIMSCYNSEKTVSRAVNSVLKQTYANWELVVVDDASTDGSLKLVKDAVGKDNRIKVICHNTNQGAGISRRDGISASTGEYTTFLDSDDTLTEKALELLVDNAVRTNTDIVSPGYRTISKEEIVNRKPQERVVKGKDKFAVDTSDALRFLNPCLVKATLWDKVTYSSRRFVEDTPTLVQLLFFAKSRSIMSDVTYNYYQNEGSLIHSASNVKKYIYEALCTIDCYKFFKEQNDDYPIALVFAKLSKFSIDTVKGFKQEREEILNFLKTIKI